MPPYKKKAPVKEKRHSEGPSKQTKATTPSPKNNSIIVASRLESDDSLSEGSPQPDSPVSAKVSVAAQEDAMNVDAANGESPESGSSPVPAPASPQATSSNTVARVNGEANEQSHRPASPPVVAPQPRLNYDNCNLDEITMLQLHEDIDAYNHDISFCQAQLAEPDLTPQESRTFQLRLLDLNHQIRHCQHRIETLRIQMRGRPIRGGFNSLLTNGTTSTPSNQSTVNKAALKAYPSTAGTKRASTAHQDESTATMAKRPKISPGPPRSTEIVPSPNGFVDNDAVAENLSLQRLGYWKCRLCEAPKYLLAPAGRTPAMPCKWPLKDISKMITHFTEMHLEHSPTERCIELGTALAKNRGPFEYWLRRTRGQDIGDGSCIEDCIGQLIVGKMPDFLRALSRAAAGMPLED